jgi:hypothetical protein
VIQIRIQDESVKLKRYPPVDKELGRLLPSDADGPARTLFSQSWPAVVFLSSISAPFRVDTSLVSREFKLAGSWMLRSVPGGQDGSQSWRAGRPVPAKAGASKPLTASDLGTSGVPHPSSGSSEGDL